MTCLQVVRSLASFSLASRWPRVPGMPFKRSASRHCKFESFQTRISLIVRSPSMHAGFYLRSSCLLLNRSSAKPGSTLSNPSRAQSTVASIQTPVVYHTRLPQHETAFIRMLPPGEKLGEGEAPSHRPSQDPRQMTVTDIRSATILPTLKCSGFQLLPFLEPPNIVWDDTEQVRFGQACRHS